MLVKSYFYEFKMYFFDKGEPEEFLLFVRNFKITINASEMLSANVNIQYLCMHKNCVSLTPYVIRWGVRPWHI